MVQNSLIMSVDGQQLAHTLGSLLTDSDFDRCLKKIEIQQPLPGKQFWQSTEAQAGIYIILNGKVRLVDDCQELLFTLDEGDSFGENTLFSEVSFQSYSARASLNLKLAYLSSKLLQNLNEKYHEINEHLYHQAVIRDFLLLCPQLAPLHKHPGLVEVLSLLEKHELPQGKLPEGLNNQKLWLIRRGELTHTSGNILNQGSIDAPIQQNGYWEVTQPTEIYSLNPEQWEIVLNYLPQLAQVISSNTEGSQIQLQGSADIANYRKNLNPRSQITTSHIRRYKPERSGPQKSNLQRAKPQIPKIQTPKIQSPKVKSSKKNQQEIVRGQPGKKISQAYFPSPKLQVGHLLQRITRRYPFFQQQSSSDCGAASLVMIGQYWGKRFSINRLREISHADRNGASLRGLVLAAESIGFTTRPVKTNLLQLEQQSLPAIAHWEGKHYIVVYEVTRTHVIVGDPAIGQRNLTRAEFETGWTGYTLLLQPTALLKEAEQSNLPFWQFIELVKPHRLVLLEIFLASVFIQVLGLITPVFTQLLLDRVVVQRSTLTLNAIGLGLLLFGFFKIAMTGLRQYLLDHVANRIDIALIVGFINHTLRLPLEFFESRYVGDIISRVQENHKIQQFLTGETLSILLDMLTMFVYTGLMFWYSWKLALLVLVIVPPFILLALVATPFLRKISQEIFAASNEQTKYLIQSLTGIRTIKSLAVEQTVRWHWEELFAKSIKKSFSGQIIGNTLSIFSSTIQTLVTTLLLWFGVWQVIQGELSIGQLVAFNMLMGNVISPFQRLTFVWNELQEITIAIERINDIIDSKPEEDLQEEIHQSLPPLEGHIRFEQVTFRYNPDSEINNLENISFEAKPGQTIALVGRSGSGKTTLSKLCLGFYLPTEGNILIDGYDMSSISLASLRQQVGVVDQDTFLFGGTIRENISIAFPEASLEEVIEAANQAGAHEFIKELPMGYETQIGEGGGMLSGGQKQRLAIARALLGNPRLLILDEATSHLDTESERIIQNNLNTILKDRTTLVIAHRLSTIRNADLILVLNKGVLVESGTHEQLMEKRGQYFYLNQKQLAVVS
ncbi:peptidase domain-containing ABC transporter [Mastigocoleus testarum]|uniref:ABC transporter ATP-binding protein n=1 Tax=Mastigocoleus testarum BC008 TaxID=371196 RepID=A0A0V7ZLR4_9CYAN|nr:peptidase domain-containing ABC transporter [Mastigocoleus testarum]KST65238.1 ABC transporter ATP-binding protein [Mastigocoleus testarum BC008]